MPKNSQGITKLKENYEIWLSHGVEIVLVSLNETPDVCAEFASQQPFTTVCETKKLESMIAQDYHKHATPAMYLLDNKREILLHPKSVKQMNAWVDWYLVEGNR